MIELGRKVRDRVTGLTGIATGRCEYLNGCIQYYIEPKINKSGDMKGKWIDEVQIEVLIGDGIKLNKVDKAKVAKAPAGPRSNAPKMN